MSVTRDIAQRPGMLCNYIRTLLQLHTLCIIEWWDHELETMWKEVSVTHFIVLFQHLLGVTEEIEEKSQSR